MLFGVFVPYDHFDWLFEACMGYHFRMPFALAVAGAERRVSHLKVISSVSGEYLFFTAVLEAMDLSFHLHLVSLILRLYMVIDDGKKLCCWMCIVSDTLMDVRRMILVLALNDDFSVIHWL